MVHLSMGKLRIVILHWLHRLLDVMSTTEVEATAMKAYGDARADIERALTSVRNREARIDARFRDLDKVAADMTLAIYDAVEQIMALGSSVSETEIADAKRTLKGSEGEQDEKR